MTASAPSPFSLRPSPFRIAVVHDWLTGMRGGENVLLSLARLYPEAPIFTLLHVRGSVAPELEARDIRTTFVQRLPDVERRYRYYLPLFPAAAAAMDLRGFDLVISSSHCTAKGVKKGAGALHLCYCHTPMRYVWDRYDDYFGAGRLRAPARWLLPVAAEALRAWDVASSARVDRFAANSAYVAGRIERYYGRPAEVIPPPVDTGFFTPGPDRPGAYDLRPSQLHLDCQTGPFIGLTAMVSGWPVSAATRLRRNLVTPTLERRVEGGVVATP